MHSANKIFKRQADDEPESFFIVERGNRMDISKIQKELAEEAIKNNKKKVETLRAKLSDAHKSYGGAFFANCFKVNRPVDLLGVAFFGPWNQKCADYHVWVEIFRSWTRVPEDGEQLLKIKTFARVDSEIFWIDFPRPIQVVPHVWYTIQFMLENGPDTFRLEESTGDVSVRVGPNDETVEFIFLRGSMQMPQMKFRMSELTEPQNSTEKLNNSSTLEYVARDTLPISKV